MTQYKLSLIGGHVDETALFTEEGSAGKCRLTCEYRGNTLSSEAADFFEALCNIRVELEKEGLIPFCYGASLNVYPSAMAREMSSGKTAYRIEIGKQATRQNLVRVFEQGPDIIPAPVLRQKEFFNEWLSSLQG
jgi:hypothetical protein